MPYILKGRKVLVTGGSRGLGELICLRFAREGCDVVANYNISESRAQEVVSRCQSDHGVKAFAVQGNMGIESDSVRVVQESINLLDGLDIIISNAGYTRFSTFSDLSALTISDWDTTFAVNVKAQVTLLHAALSTFNANTDGGVFIMTSSIAGRNTGGSSMPYSVSKAAQLHLMRCLAVTQGPKIRVNAVLPGWLRTEWGGKFDEEEIQKMSGRAVLKKETNLHDCAQAFVDIARNSSMTGQQITVDSGLGVI